MKLEPVTLCMVYRPSVEALLEEAINSLKYILKHKSLNILNGIFCSYKFITLGITIKLFAHAKRNSEDNEWDIAYCYIIIYIVCT